MLSSNKNFQQNISLELVIFTFFFITIISLKSVFVEVLSEGGSADFHLYPARCVFQGINHYHSYLNRDGECIFFMTQWGEYAQGFYILLFPFTLLDWNTAKLIWLILNIILIFLTAYFLCKKFIIDKIYSCFIIFIIFSSIVTKATLVMGQQAIFTLFFFSLPFLFKSKLSYILSGIGYFKYSIGYALLFFYLISKKYSKFFLSLIPCFLGWIIYCYITNTNLFDNLFQPIQLTLKNVSTINQIFLFSFLKNVFKIDLINQYLMVFLPSLFLNIYLILKIVKLENNLQKLSCLCLLVLVTIPHYPHDYILIVPLLVYSIQSIKRNNFLFRINFFGAIYFLNFYRAVEIYFQKFLVFLNFNVDYVAIINYIIPQMNIILLFLILVLNLNLKFFKNKNLS